MDFEPRITSDGSGYGHEHGWGCNFSFGYGYDSIDEDTETEKCRVQALQFLIAKADAEICDLEDELAILQCQLKWGQSDEENDPYKVCCAVFKQKIDSLTSSIQRLSGGNLLSGHATEGTLDIQRPAERICDIINALTSHKFSLPDEQVLLESNGKDTFANFGSPNPCMDPVHQTAGFQPSIQADEPTTAIERQPAHAISEESTSDAARYASMDSKEGRDVCKPDVEVIGGTQLDIDRCTSEQRRELGGTQLDIDRCTSEQRSEPLILEPCRTLTHCQFSDEGNSLCGVVQPGEIGDCLAGSIACESGLTSLSVVVEPLVIEDDYDMNIEQVPIGSLPCIQDTDIEDLIEDHPKEDENQSQNPFNSHTNYDKRKLSLGSVLKGLKVQRKTQSNISGVEPCNPSLTLKQLRKMGKTESSSNAKRFGHFGVTSPNTPESNLQNNLGMNECITYARAKRPQIQGTDSENSGIDCLEVANNLNTTPEAIEPKTLVKGEAKALIVVPDSTTNANDVSMAEDPIYDLETLKLKLEDDPAFLNKLKLAQLKTIMKQYKIRGSYKFKKEQMVEALINMLCL